MCSCRAPLTKNESICRSGLSPIYIDIKKLLPKVLLENLPFTEHDPKQIEFSNDFGYEKPLRLTWINLVLTFITLHLHNLSRYRTQEGVTNQNAAFFKASNQNAAFLKMQHSDWWRYMPTPDDEC